MFLVKPILLLVIVVVVVVVVVVVLFLLYVCCEVNFSINTKIKSLVCCVNTL